MSMNYGFIYDGKQDDKYVCNSDEYIFREECISSFSKMLAGIGLIAASMIALMAVPAQALVITAQENTPFSTVERAQTITFDDAPLRDLSLRTQRGGVEYIDKSGISYTGIGGDIVQGHGGGRYAAPPSQGDYNNTNNPYLSVGSFGNESSDIVTINLDVESDYFGFYFGSIDNHNNLYFYNGETLITSLTGEDILTLANGAHNINNALFLNIFAEEGENFDRVVFQSNNIAFETDNHAYRISEPVPTPAAILPILSGLCAAAKRRNQAKITEKNHQLDSL
ncbi:hypothetical protein Lepto7376_3309 [[Leptolyngbya] sp. PCC 7376]|uniref:PTPA-CTERM sorting domain-containing protein n=1 Tax=[Leptolyngbya] sp. PCC 7376 TaxID=111781 RepID=UPI00029EEE0C|nr:PTPA-CTERM sorting domain-containing protein [[Leptolyngbya] sp. PCC 7376]AFY39533.1 hypothetical protein Lepto7376_3309 [[Leptolyngbya] sp. PCC 7376]